VLKIGHKTKPIKLLLLSDRQVNFLLDEAIYGGTIMVNGNEENMVSENEENSQQRVNRVL